MWTRALRLPSNTASRLTAPVARPRDRGSAPVSTARVLAAEALIHRCLVRESHRRQRARTPRQPLRRRQARRPRRRRARQPRRHDDRTESQSRGRGGAQEAHQSPQAGGGCEPHNADATSGEASVRVACFPRHTSCGDRRLERLDSTRRWRSFGPSVGHRRRTGTEAAPLGPPRPRRPSRKFLVLRR